MTERQKAILRSIILEFMKSAEPVGSSSIVSNYNVEVSPATVRHEMVELSDMGYLFKSHSSSGRVPTNLGIRFFVKELMEEEAVSNENEVNFRMTIFKDRFEEEQLMRRVTQFLSEETGYASVILLGNILRFYGVSSLTSFKEMRDIEVIESLLQVLENQKTLRGIFEKGVSKEVCMIIGDECDVRGLRSCSFVFAPFHYLNDKEGYVGVIGPRRMRYSKVIPLLRLVRDSVQRSIRGW